MTPDLFSPLQTACSGTPAVTDRIATETVLLPHVIADGVVGEVAFLLHQAISRGIAIPVAVFEATSADDGSDPAGLHAALTARAEAIYASNAEFRSRLKGPQARDALYSFMRHWAAGEVLRRHGQAALASLPAEFRRGEAPRPVGRVA